MYRARVIPVLLLSNNGLVKTKKFKNPVYVGDPINAVKIFNEKEVDEIIVLDIDASREKRKPNLKKISEIASECFMPLCYGGGISDINTMREIFNIGIEKISINTSVVENIALLENAAKEFGSQSIVVSIDVKKNWLGKYETAIHNGRKETGKNPVDFAKTVEEKGAGEILLNSVDRDGTFTGYDIELIKKITSSVNIPVVACGGAGNIHHFKEAIANGASAVAAGSMFVFHGKHRAVLISYPSQEMLQINFNL